jgi:inosine-uridine nucleoside N-ribohydrolase
MDTTQYTKENPINKDQFFDWLNSTLPEDAPKVTQESYFERVTGFEALDEYKFKFTCPGCGKDKEDTYQDILERIMNPKKITIIVVSPMFGFGPRRGDIFSSPFGFPFFNRGFGEA